MRIHLTRPDAGAAGWLPLNCGRQAGTVGYDKIWRNFTEWYADHTNPVVQRVLLSGRSL